jgi:phosphoribosylamine--glycine ligase
VSTDILVVGSGAREHALVWKLAASNRVGRIYAAPGNAGMTTLADLLPVGVTDFDGLTREVESRGIGLVVVGPEDPLARGLADHLTERGHLVFGPGSDAARIESSKTWAKDLMVERGVPTALSVTCDSLVATMAAVDLMTLPVVLKADGLAAGKGVFICETREGAERAARELFEAYEGSLLVEEYLEGMEVSFLALTDGTTVIPLVPACDYKRAQDSDAGPNTGGMGAYTPPGIVTPEMIDGFVNEIIAPVVQGMADRGIVYRGVLYAGLMLTADGPKVLEFNCRFGDPETQVILPMLNADLVELCEATARGDLASVPPLEWYPGACVGVVLASGGYPGAYTAGHPIDGLNAIPEGGVVFHAGTTFRGDEVVTAGGRVLTAVGRGDDMESARDLAYATAAAISFQGVYYRTDIAAREIPASL